MSTLKQINKGYADHQQDRIYHEGGVSPALASSNFGHDIKVAISMKVKNQTKQGYIECPIGGGDGLGFP